MNKMRMESKDIIDSNIEKLKELFPSCVQEDKIDFDMLKQELSSVVIDDKKEKYQLTWPGKKEAIVLSNERINKTLRPIKEKSVDFDKTENIYIEGDNLDVLKILQESYLNKIKCIYIDPPYNTGNDFIYNDSFKKDSNEELVESGQADEEGNRLVSNNQSNGRFHSDWLSMMYPRLKLARNLLTDDGVLVISIDDNEIDNLKKICLEIFGENNVEIAIWNKEAEGSSGTLKQTSTFRRIHEYILFAYKNKSRVQFYKINEKLEGRENELQTANLAVNMENEKRNHPNYFTITNPSGEKFTRQWKWSKEEIERLIRENLIYWGSDGHKQPRLIIPMDDRRTTFLLSILNYGGTTVGRKDFEKIMGNEIEFSYPKPVILLKKIINSVTKDNDIVLDFFSGSGTTADSVLQLDAETNENRKFIMVQLPEKCNEKSEAYKKGYKTICDIGEERIRRAGNKIKEEINTDIDLGFRVYKVDSSNMKDVYYKPSKLSQTNLFDMMSNIKEDRTPEDLLTQVMLDLGLTLDLKIEEKTILNNKVYYVADNALVACFDDNIDINIIDEICKCKPLKVVFKDMSFKSDKDKINLEERVKKLSPDTEISIL